MNRWYLVLSPWFTYVEVVIPETGQGPTEETRDVAVVKAPNAQAAKWEACRLWEEHARPRQECWPWIARGDGKHPLSGVTATRWDDVRAEEPEAPAETEPFGWGPFYAEVTA